MWVVTEIFYGDPPIQKHLEPLCPWIPCIYFGLCKVTAIFFFSSSPPYEIYSPRFWDVHRYNRCPMRSPILVRFEVRYIVECWRGHPTQNPMYSRNSISDLLILEPKYTEESTECLRLCSQCICVTIAFHKDNYLQNDKRWNRFKENIYTQKRPFLLSPPPVVLYLLM